MLADQLVLVINFYLKMQRNNSYDSHFRFKQPILTQNLPLKEVDHHPGHYFIYLLKETHPPPKLKETTEELAV